MLCVLRYWHILHFMHIFQILHIHMFCKISNVSINVWLGILFSKGQIIEVSTRSWVNELAADMGRLWHPWKICAFVLTQRIGVLQNPRSFPTPNVSVSCATRPSIVQTRPINITFITGQSLFTSDCISWQIHLGITWYSELFSLYMPLGYMAKNHITKNGFVILIFKQELWPIFQMLAMLLELESPSFLQKVAGSIVCSTRGISPLWRLFS